MAESKIKRFRIQNTTPVMKSYVISVSKGNGPAKKVTSFISPNSIISVDSEATPELPVGVKILAD